MFFYKVEGHMPKLSSLGRGKKFRPKKSLTSLLHAALQLFVSRYCHMGVDCNVSTAYCWSSSGNDVDWLCLIISSTVAVCDWCISILVVVVNDWRISILIVLTRGCSPIASY